jgi:glucan biosynthesis protein C
MLLGVVLHTLISYRPPPDGLVNDPAQGTLLAYLIVDAIHVFRMPSFFVISGFFGALLWSKRGSRAMLRNRFERLVLPLLVFALLLWPALLFSGTFASAVTSGAVDPVARGLAKVSTGASLPPHSIHLWFLNYLVWIIVIVGALVTVLERWGIHAPRFLERARAAAESPWRSLVWFGGLNLLWWYGMGWDSLPTSGAWIPDPVILGYYTLCFGLGWTLFAAKFDLSTLGDRAWTFVAMGVACFVLRFALGWAEQEFTPVDGVEPPIYIRFAHGGRTLLGCVSLVAFSRGLAGWFMRYASAGSTGWRYVSDASYWVYLIHLPLCALVTALLVGWDVHVLVKCVTAIALVSLIAVATYDLAIRATFVGRFLNGRRYPRGSFKLGLVASVVLVGGMAHAVLNHEPLEDLPPPWLGGAHAQELVPDEQVAFPVVADQPDMPDVTVHGCIGIGPYAICPDTTRFDVATEACDRLGGGLVVLEDEEEERRLSDLMWRLTEQPYWIGASDKAVEGQWRWSSGAEIAYDVWMGDEPNDWGGKEDCAAANWGRRRGWNDLPCEARLHFVCEFSQPLKRLETAIPPDSEP